ncbi:MAG: (d)CMP kinase [Acidihalobacter sp.]
MSAAAPVITIDGPSGSGKGTVSRLLADKLGWHLLERGALYRLVALAAQRRSVALEDVEGLAGLAVDLDTEFPVIDGVSRVYLDGDDVTLAIRAEECGVAASRVAALPAVREALLERQRAFRRLPGLVADGRDMGTVVFPDAPLKIFLTASTAARADRRWKQLREQGVDANLDALYRDLEERDARDAQRSASPLKAAPDAVTVDSTAMDIPAVMARILSLIADRGVQ